LLDKKGKRGRASAMSRLPALLALLTAAITSPGCNSAGPAADHGAPATVRLPAVPGRPGAAYLELPAHRVHGALLGVTSPQVGRIEMHETMSHGEMTGMRPLQRVWAQPDRPIVFAPGARHLMLYEIDPSLRPGQQVQLVFRFEHGPPETITAVAVAAGGGQAR
jgi:copper(I)-binding protein